MLDFLAPFWTTSAVTGFPSPSPQKAAVFGQPFAEGYTQALSSPLNVEQAFKDFCLCSPLKPFCV
jgi:hypothetical protein